MTTLRDLNVTITRGKWKGKKGYLTNECTCLPMVEAYWVKLDGQKASKAFQRCDFEIEPEKT